jgi:hypothetical protein
MEIDHLVIDVLVSVLVDVSKVVLFRPIMVLLKIC